MLLEGLYSAMTFYSRNLTRIGKTTTPKEYGIAIQGKRKRRKKKGKH